MKGIERTALAEILSAPQGEGVRMLMAGDVSLLTSREEILAAVDQCPEPEQAARTVADLLTAGRLTLASVDDATFVKALREDGASPAATGRTLLREAGVTEIVPSVHEQRPAYASYGRQQVTEADLRAVRRALLSDFLTCGPAVAEFEAAVSRLSGVAHGVAVSSGTAALHCAMHALGIRPGDEVIVPPLTFSATANCVRYLGGTPVFADIDPEFLTIDPASVAARITSRTKAVVAVDYAGQPCDYARLRELAGDHGLALAADACHSIGGSDNGRSVGTLADLTVYSFHPVKHLTCGEGGMVVTDDQSLADRARAFRSHGITRDFRDRASVGSHAYDIEEIGFNYRLPDINCALGLSQLDRLGVSIAIRQALAARYREGLAAIPGITAPSERAGVNHAYHLFVVQVDRDRFGLSRDELFTVLADRGIGVNVHYPPVHLLSAYRRELGTGPGLCPVAEAACERLLTLPLHPGMDAADVEYVVQSITEVGQ
ncbi:DegT/DnrJ/EryC1/StrS family aminotransferase [Pseudodesulfovibrio methanolicus]|uniref:DegT/DnrJ/EryC1/StrS family aminotransferase n=1 Tax=Pseudodesulfovibrio methanolicus TaxID=3126690 RepID=A0ABZ2J287_9BACT